MGRPSASCSGPPRCRLCCPRRPLDFNDRPRSYLPGAGRSPASSSAVFLFQERKKNRRATKRPNNHRPVRPSLEACGSFGRWFVSVATGRLSRPGRKHGERARMAVERPFGLVGGKVLGQVEKNRLGPKAGIGKRLRSESPERPAPTAGTGGPFSLGKVTSRFCGPWLSTARNTSVTHPNNYISFSYRVWRKRRQTLRFFERCLCR